MKVKLLSKYGKVPTKSNNRDAGYDLYSAIDEVINPGDYKLIKLDIAISDFNPETYGRIAGRSGYALRGVQVLGGVVDEPYQGNVGVILAVCANANILHINRGDRIAQIIFERYDPNVTFEEVAEFEEITERGTKGFGSTGV